MNCFENDNNKVFIRGEIVTEAEFSHEVYGEGFYEIFVEVKSNSALSSDPRSLFVGTFKAP